MLWCVVRVVLGLRQQVQVLALEVPVGLWQVLVLQAAEAQVLLSAEQEQQTEQERQAVQEQQAEPEL